MAEFIEDVEFDTHDIEELASIVSALPSRLKSFHKPPLSPRSQVEARIQRLRDFSLVLGREITMAEKMVKRMREDRQDVEDRIVYETKKAAGSLPIYAKFIMFLMF